jgi:radical SAM protein with 4Fe4S-binding SPASM domain
MSTDVFKSIIDKSWRSRLVKPIIKIIGLGEPLLNPNVLSMVKHAKSNGLTVEIVSNFTLADPKFSECLVEAQLDYLGVSVDAASPQVFERIRAGAKFEDVINNVKEILKIRKSQNSTKPKVFFRSTINKENSDEVPAIKELAKSIGVDYVIFSNQIVSSKEKDTQPSLTTHASRKAYNASLWIKKKTSLCPAMRRCYVTHDGKVMPCNFMMMLIPREDYPLFEFGNVTQNSLLSIWFSKRYKQFRIQKALGVHPYFCKNCPASSSMD